MPLSKLIEVLERNNVNYVSILHREAYTAQELAHTVHVSGKDFVKSIITMDNNGNKHLIVLPANYKLNLNKLAAVLKVKKIEIIPENKFKNLFPNTEIGAMPPFGTMFNLNTIIDEHLQENSEIVFNAGSHTEAIKMKQKDYFSIEQPTIANIAEHLH